MEKRVVALSVAYDGEAFRGFARQPGLPTVQGSLEDALKTITRADVETVGAGRTDSGVHALGQVVSFPDPGGLGDLAALPKSLTALTPDFLVVADARWARPGFSSRFDAVRREYRYRIATGSSEPVLLSRHAWWVRKELDVHAMRLGAQSLLGEHDFKSFCVAASAEGKSTVRSIEVLELEHESHLGEDVLMMRVAGKAFLHSMVRIIAGTLVEVGLSKKEPGWVKEALVARERAAAGQTAPAHALVFHRVDYPDDVWL